jgi:hypothetical protein
MIAIIINNDRRHPVKEGFTRLQWTLFHHGFVAFGPGVQIEGLFTRLHQHGKHRKIA